MSASRAKIDFVFDHIIEHPRPSMGGERSGTGLVLLGLLTISIAAALFVQPPAAVAMHPTAASTIARAP